VAQPKNLGTGPGILLPLARVHAREPDACVAVLPSDHHVPHPEPFLDALEAAAHSARLRHAPATLLGVRATHAETEYGWIVPGRRVSDKAFPEHRVVSRFVEKPIPRIAEELHRMGALWNTFAFAGRLRELWRLATLHLPDHAQKLERYAAQVDRSGERQLLADLYAQMAQANFSQDILEAAQGLAVLPVEGSGWSDWGSPARVLESLRGTDELLSILHRIRERGASTQEWCSQTVHAVA
jgi:mannose-1-phosphate guanylyltransferase